ncbi:hypothetical protein D8674_019086 [Pyrus ussuriensis x Pyrus communis]|uniref:Uncharacterized protein n=1 Tax=Pyrus ussuriensis x Pyrus communis TaxID=2448454 RepID=A0A5N5GJW5_9ROSA|nr:hypothetical protein D8674_019086 [Pyrus ussuriensis x Pyrus communis]
MAMPLAMKSFLWQTYQKQVHLIDDLRHRHRWDGMVRSVDQTKTKKPSNEGLSRDELALISLNLFMRVTNTVLN